MGYHAYDDLRLPSPGRGGAAPYWTPNMHVTSPRRNAVDPPSPPRSPRAHSPRRRPASPPYTRPSPPEQPLLGDYSPLLPRKGPAHRGRNTLVLDLDETLVHSTLRPQPHTHYDILMEMEVDEKAGKWGTVYVKKRPGVIRFLEAVSRMFEVVLLTASLEDYADPLLDELEGFPGGGGWSEPLLHHRLFRDSCANYHGDYVKDLRFLGRPLNEVIIVDNSPTSYMFQPENALPITSWYDDTRDRELDALLPVLEEASRAEDVREVLGHFLAGQGGRRRGGHPTGARARSPPPPSFRRFSR